MRTLLSISAVLLGTAMAVAALAGNALAATESVDVQDFEFSPTTISIDAGDTIEWQFVGAVQHNVTAVDGSFTSPDLTSGSFDHTFNTPGTFAYYCTFHGTAQGDGMAGTISVAAGEEPTSTPEDEDTATPEPTDTPEPEDTVEAPTATSTAPAAATATSTVEVMPISAPDEEAPPSTGGGAAPEAVGAPATGTGTRGDAGWPYWIAAPLAAAATSFGAAVVLTRRRYEGR